MQTVNGLFRFGVVLAMTSHAIGWTQDLAVHYFPRPPYVYEQDGHLSGLTGAPVLQALRSAGIRFTLQQTPASRFMATIQRGEGPDCGIGWFRNSEREAIGKFSKPIYQDEAMAVITYAGHTVLRNGLPVEAILGNPELLLLTKQSFSYGRELDAQILQWQTRREIVTVENLGMLRMLKARRADYMLMAPEELTGAVAAAGLQLSDFTALRPPNMPKGELRYLWCSKAVPDAVMARINVGIH